MSISSEYSFPLFISSTEYNLRDLRAELANFLESAGYKPMLSSKDGFPDSSPKLEPWESCLPVLEHSFVVTLIIDGRYGQSLPWPNYKEIFGEKKFSPTHGEYKFAHIQGKRLFVFIRKEVMIYYQSYRILNEKGKTEEEIFTTLKDTLPPHIDPETLKFVSEVKTTRPIPWIMEFEDVTDIKSKLQKKLLNELAEVYLIKHTKMDMAIMALNEILDNLKDDEKEQALKRINAVKDYPEKIEQISELEKKIKGLKEQYTSIKESKKEERLKLEEQIKAQTKELEALKKDSHGQFLYTDGRLKFDDLTIENYPTGSFIDATNILGGRLGYLETSKKCKKCGRENSSPFSITSSLIGTINDNLRECPNCNIYWCDICWTPTFLGIEPNESDFISTDLSKCPDCRKIT